MNDKPEIYTVKSKAKGQKTKRLESTEQEGLELPKDCFSSNSNGYLLVCVGLGDRAER